MSTDKTQYYMHFIPSGIIVMTAVIVGAMIVMKASFADIGSVLTVACFIGMIAAQVVVPTSVTVHKNIKHMLLFAAMWIAFLALCGSVIFVLDYTARLHMFR